MLDNHYKIVTREIAKTESRAKYFIAELSEVYVVVDGERQTSQFSHKEFSGKTQTAAIIQASDAMQNWLKKQTCEVSKSLEYNLVQDYEYVR